MTSAASAAQTAAAMEEGLAGPQQQPDGDDPASAADSGTDETATMRGHMTLGQRVLTQIGAFVLGTLMNWTGEAVACPGPPCLL